MQDLKPTIWPLLFTHKGSVFGNGFLADIELCGRLLAEPNAEGVWLYGVKPGALAVGAVNLATANTELLKALVAVFVDFAEESKTFGQFKSMVEQYFNETDDDSINAWNEAVKILRASGAAPADLPIKSADSTAVFVNVSERPLEQISPKDNRLNDSYAPSQLAAAA